MLNASSRALPLQEKLFWDPASEDPQVCSRIAPREIITPSHLQVGFLYERWPVDMGIVPICNVQSL